MSKITSKLTMWLGASLASAMLLSSAAHAVPTLSLSIDDGVNPAITLVDTTHLGFLNYTGSLGAFTINVTTGIGEGSLHPLAGGFFDLNSINVTALSAGTLTLRLTEYDLVQPTGPVLMHSAIGGTVGSPGQPASTLTFDRYIDTSNTPFGIGTLLASDTFTGSGAAFSTQSDNLANITAPYSQTLVVTLTAPAGSASSFDALMTPAPEPASMAMLGAGLLIMSLVHRRRTRQTD